MPATAKVRVTIEIQVGSSWGDNCTVEQVYQQAATEAKGAVNLMIRHANELGRRCKLIDTVSVDAVVTPKTEVS